MIGWLAVSLCASGLWGVILFVSSRGWARLWPPSKGSWFTAFWAWGLTTAIYVGLIRAASADWNALGWNWWLRWGVGGVGLTLASFWIQGRGIVDLGLKGTSGWDVGVVTTGAYARRRHPQYAGQIVSLIGLGILGGALPGLVAAAAGCAALFYASVAEERWLARQHPETFEAYRKRVPFW